MWFLRGMKSMYPRKTNIGLVLKFEGMRRLTGERGACLNDEAVDWCVGFTEFVHRRIIQTDIPVLHQ
jgi:hypothetical protein